MGRQRPLRQQRPHFRGALLGAALVLFAALPAASSGAGVVRTPRHLGTVNVLYAASLQNAFEQIIAPRFDQTTGYSFSGYPAGSSALATEIKGKALQGDVFVSASQSVNSTLMGPSNGAWVNWFVTFASSPLVIGFNPNSSFAALFKHEPWWQVIAQPGFRLGRTDPTIDPKGKLSVQAITAASAIYNSPGLSAITATNSNVYPEQTLVGLLQAGQLDGGFFYSSEARAARIPTISLGRIHLAATYTATVLANGANPAGGTAFVSFLLGKAGRTLETKEGLEVLKPRLSGPRGEVPRALRGLV